MSPYPIGRHPSSADGSATDHPSSTAVRIASATSPASQTADPAGVVVLGMGLTAEHRHRRSPVGITAVRGQRLVRRLLVIDLL